MASNPVSLPQARPPSQVWNFGPRWLSNFLNYLRRNPTMVAGLLVLLGLLVFWIVGSLSVDIQKARPLSVRVMQPPSAALPFGSDRAGRDLFACAIAGIPMTFRIGLIAGLIGVGIGTVLGFFSAYYGGAVDTTIRTIVDVGLTIPGLMILIIIATSFRGGLTVEQMALVVASLAWLNPTRTIRSQVLTLKQRAYVQVARLSGMGSVEIIFKELMPNLLSYLAAASVSAISAAILASIGLEALGLGPMDSPTLGMTIYWVIYYAALINGWWWWWSPPIILISLLFIGLFLVSLGLDEYANPRRRRMA
jgi:peptide/nickel transport system permease protein